MPPNTTAPAFKIGGELYPIPTAFTLGDGLLVAELTGLDMEDFGERLDAMNLEDEGRDLQVIVGMIGVAVWHVHPKWDRAKVRRFVERVDVEAFEGVEGGDDGDPPEPAPELVEGPARPSTDSSGASTTSPAAALDEELE